MKGAWRDPIGDGEGLEGQAISRATAGERLPCVGAPRKPLSSIFSPATGDGVNPLLSSELRETPQGRSRCPSQ